MSLVLDDYEGGGKFDNPTAGSTVAVVGGIFDVGLQDTSYGVKAKVVVAYELDERDPKGRRFVVFTPYNRTIHPKAALRQLVDSVFPQLPAEKRKSFNMSELIGKSVLVQVGITEKGRARALGVTPLVRGMAGITAEEDYSKPFGLAKWYVERAMSQQAASEKQEEKRKATEEPKPETTHDTDDIPF